MHIIVIDMKNIRYHELMETILQNSQHMRAKRLQQISPYRAKPIVNIHPDSYINAFLDDAHCEYLTSDYYFLSKIMHNHNIAMGRNELLSQKYLRGKINARIHPPKKTDFQVSILEVIKRLNSDKTYIGHYEEAEELITMMNEEDVMQNKKYLIFLYKWIVNQRQRVDNVIEKMCLSLKEEIIKKITAGHESEEQKKKIHIEFTKINKLADARKLRDQGKKDEAKEAYESIFEDDRFDNNIRMEALSYLCEDSKEKGEFDQIMAIVGRLKEKNDVECYEKYLRNFMGPDPSKK